MSSTIVSQSFSLRKTAVFELCVALSQIFGFAMVILSGYMFNTNGPGIVWPSKTPGTADQPGETNTLKNFHGFFMITGLVFFQGEALLSYRLYRHEAKMLSKFIHVVFHILAMAFFSTALAVVIIQKNNAAQLSGGQVHHFTTVHSWIGLAVMGVYVVQFSFGALNYLNPFLSVKVKQAFMPYHRAVGCISFFSCTIQAIIGYTEYITTAPDDTLYGCYFAMSCKSKLDLIYNFSMISMILFSLSVLVVVVPAPWRRQKTLDEMK